MTDITDTQKPVKDENYFVREWVNDWCGFVRCAKLFIFCDYLKKINK